MFEKKHFFGKALLSGKRPLPFFIIFLLLLNGILFLVWIQKDQAGGFKWNKPADLLRQSSSPTPSIYSEAEEVKKLEISYGVFEKYFKNLAQRKGATYAYEILRFVPLLPNIDTHLLGHAIGDILYKQEGLKGIEICTNDFRNACSHTIVVGLFMDKGEGALPEIADVCRLAPGGPGAYTMCFHGLGHGILAYTGYDVPKAVGLCNKTGTPQYRGREAAECIGGIVMETIGGGFHDKALWEKQRQKYLKKENPLSLCSADFMPKDAKSMCYLYLTPYLFEAVGGSLFRLTDDDLKKAFKLCGAIDLSENPNLDACYGGFGKEFVALLEEHDIRREVVESLSADQLLRVYTWCSLADSAKGIGSCVSHAQKALYWGGENDRGVSLRFCGAIPDIQYRSSCFSGLIQDVRRYIHDPLYKEAFCKELPSQYSGECQDMLRESDRESR